MAGPTAQLLAGDPSELSAASNGQADTAIRLAEVLTELIGPQTVASDQHFFDDLGADSMVMARFCARVRKRADLPSVSMTDIYRHPTISSLRARPHRRRGRPGQARGPAVEYRCRPGSAPVSTSSAGRCSC